MISLNQLGEVIARLLGDAKDYGADVSRRIRSIRGSVEQLPLVSLLPYQSYEPLRKLFLNQESIGFGLELLPISGIGEEEINRIVSMLNDKLPVDGDLHIQLYATNKIGTILNNFVAARSNNSELIKKIAEMRAKYYEHCANNSITPFNPYFARNYHIYLYYAQPIKSYGYEMQFDELSLLRETWKTSLSSVTAVDDITVETLLTVLKEITNPTQSVYWKTGEYREYDSINTQVAECDVAYDILPECVSVDGSDGEYHVQSLFAESLPQRSALWQMGENIGKLFESSLQLTAPLAINLHLKALGKAESQAKAQSEFMMNDKKANSPLARLVPAIRKKHEEWTYLREHLDGTERLCKVYFSVTLFSKKNNAVNDKTHVVDLFNSNGFKLATDKYLQAGGFLSNLPFTMTAGLFEDLSYFERFKTVTTFNAVNLMPIIGDWKGNPKSKGQMYLTRRGQIVNFSSHDNPDGNKNVVVGAKSRSGKSVIIQDCVSDILSRGGIVRILDIGGSYSKTLEYFGGSHIEINENLCINPFTNVTNFVEASPQIQTIVCTMAHPGGDSTDIEKALIGNAIQEAWELKKNQATITTVVERLRDVSSDVSDDLVLLLTKYTKDGSYASYFEGESTVKTQQNLLEIDFEPVKSKPDLKAVLVMSILLQINEEIYNSSRDIPKLCIIDEAWDLLHSSQDAAKFIEAGYRRVAKHNGAFVTILQSINDYFHDECGIAVYENSDHQLILAQKDETLADLMKHERLRLSAYEERLVRSIHGSDQYKECLIRTPQGSSLVRVVIDPFSRILYSSTAEHVARVDELKESGYSLEEAVLQTAKEVYPNEC